MVYYQILYLLYLLEEDSAYYQNPEDRDHDCENLKMCFF
jgi:hypothetical protein